MILECEIIVTVAELVKRYKRNFPDGHYFDTDTLEFWGDTMSNYGVRRHESGNWELFRKNPVRSGQMTSAMFKAATFEYMAGEFEIVFAEEGNELKGFLDATVKPNSNGRAMFGTCGGKL